jgi:hypothetical protein
VPEKSDSWLSPPTHSLNIPLHLDDKHLCHNTILNGISIAVQVESKNGYGAPMEVIMKKLIVLFVVLMPALSYAQAPTQKERASYGYAFTGLIVASNGGEPGLQAGIGGEGIIYKGFGVGGEIGYFRQATFGSDSGIGLLSVNPSYHFMNASKSRRLVPFVTGGFSLFFRSGAVIGSNFGGGITYWLKDRIGVRLEVRDQIPAYSGIGHFPSFRAALTFR